jgi:hypothetical protein
MADSRNVRLPWMFSPIKIKDSKNNSSIPLVVASGYFSQVL